MLIHVYTTTCVKMQCTVLYSQYVHACCSKTITYSSANTCPPAQMQHLAREMRRFIVGTLEHTVRTSYPKKHQIISLKISLISLLPLPNIVKQKIESLSILQETFLTSTSRH